MTGKGEFMNGVEMWSLLCKIADVYADTRMGHVERARQLPGDRVQPQEGAFAGGLLAVVEDGGTVLQPHVRRPPRDVAAYLSVDPFDGERLLLGNGGHAEQDDEDDQARDSEEREQGDGDEVTHGRWGRGMSGGWERSGLLASGAADDDP